jgi:hypothetical protein
LFEGHFFWPSSAGVVSTNRLCFFFEASS